MNNPLTLIPAKVRLSIYLGLFLAAVVLTSVTSYFTTINEAVPTFVTGLTGALVAPTAVFAGVAAANTTKDQAPESAPADPSVDPSILGKA